MKKYVGKLNQSQKLTNDVLRKERKQTFAAKNHTSQTARVSREWSRMGWVLQSAKKGAPFEARLWPRETKFQMEGNYLNQ